MPEDVYTVSQPTREGEELSVRPWPRRQRELPPAAVWQGVILDIARVYRCVLVTGPMVACFCCLDGARLESSAEPQGVFSFRDGSGKWRGNKHSSSVDVWISGILSE